MAGLVYRKEGQIEAYVAYSEGKHGVYLMPYLHPEVLSDAPDIVFAALRQIDRCRKLPMYTSVCAAIKAGWKTRCSIWVSILGWNRR